MVPAPRHGVRSVIIEATHPVGLSEEERDSLLSELGSVIARHGEERFLTAPLLDLTPEFFPDTWSPDDDGVFALVASVFVHADLGDLTVSLVEDASSSTIAENVPGVRADAVHRTIDPDGPARLVAEEDGTCVLGVDPFGRDHPEMLVASLCRVAAALFDARGGDPYRQPAHRPPRDDREKRRAEIVAMYLGYGRLLANDAYSIFRGPRVLVHRVAGVLGLEATCFLLAAQLRARPEDHHPVLRSLGTNQAALVAEYLRSLDEGSLSARLQLSRGAAS